MKSLNLKLTALLPLFFAMQVCLAQQKTDVVTNATVVSLVKAGLSGPVIITTIQNSNASFTLTPGALIALKKQGVSDDVIAAMVQKNSNPTPTLNPAKSDAGLNEGAENELSSLEPGIYYADAATGKATELDASVFSQSKMGSGILTSITYGIAKTKAKAVLSGTQANFQISSRQPVFYFVFPHNGNGNIGNEGSNGGWYSNASSPNEFLMVKFDIKKNGREVVTGSFGTYSGFSGGIDDKNKVPYRFIKLQPGVYKVFFENPIDYGEYAFLFAGTQASAMGGTPSQKAFDFSVAQSGH